jgi:hypothetical protein
MPAPALRRGSNPETAAIRQERSSASGLTGDVDGELPPAQNTAFWVVFVIMPYKPRAEHNGYRATTTTSDRHTARLPIRHIGELIADSGWVRSCSGPWVTARRLSTSAEANAAGGGFGCCRGLPRRRTRLINADVRACRWCDRSVRGADAAGPARSRPRWGCAPRCGCDWARGRGCRTPRRGGDRTR